MNKKLQNSVLCIGCTLLLGMAGCEKSPEPQFRFNSVALLTQESLELEPEEHFPSEYQTEIGNILTALYGTPNDPKFPFLLGEEDPAHDIISLDKLKMSAGRVNSDRKGEPFGLYREHCAQCHGISGDGAGPTAAFLNPYPRDFRLGKFKFKSTPLRQPPTNDDLTRIIQNGIPGTAMPSFRTLSDEEVASLVDYVKYLTIRGQHEHRLIKEISSLETDQPFLDFDLLTNDEGADEEAVAENLEEFQDQLYVLIGEYFSEDILSKWLDVEDAVTQVPAAPPAFDSKHDQHTELLAKGKALFRGAANCVQCHGETGLGDGQTENLDDWTKELAVKPGFDPDNRETYREFIEAGGLKPRYIRPRNLRMPVFRGGNRPDDIYRRIANGIEGTPMPSSPALSAEDIWALVYYVKALPYENQKPELPTNDRVVD